jgi:cellulose synthase/poly-beta-1,6-N-acetylglucosamine synthase-like glycosyltransferase
MKLAFWINIFIIFYTFIGYGVLLYILLRIRIAIKGRRLIADAQKLPTLTLIIAAYNEADILDEKVSNTLSLAYPEDKLNIVFVSDGSTDGSEKVLSKYERLKVMHSPARRGKINAIHRAMNEVDSEVVVFTDANTFLNEDALINIARHFNDAKVGAVSGEKRVRIDKTADATAGEGIYWKYESLLKRMDSELYSVVGAAGELFAVRTALYEAVPHDTVLDDFMFSMLIAKKGYRIVYEPNAFALESPSQNIKEELKRKVRIAAGGIQSIVRLKALLNPFHNPVLFFQYISHRVLRWTITPFCLLSAFLLNIAIVMNYPDQLYYTTLWMQVVFYLAAFTGFLLEKKQLKIKLLFTSYYFCMMNYAVLAGIYRYFFTGQSVIWDKAKRKN